MKKNVGGIDRILRGVLGIAIIAAGLIFSSWWGLIGVVFLFTSLFSFCPAYLPFGLSSCKTESNK